MTSCMLKGKRFYCREWCFSKLHHCLENRHTAKTCGALIMGGPGCGKSAVCSELIWPTTTGKQKHLSSHALAYHFCQAHNMETLSMVKFIHSLVDQISKSELISGYVEKLKDPDMQVHLDPKNCEQNPDIAFKNAVLLPLSSITQPSHNVFFVVDSIDESQEQTEGESANSRTIAELLANNHMHFPPWLLLVCSARKQSRTITRMFTGFRKISLDDLRKSHVVRDVQQYILCRLDCEDDLRQHLSRDTAEMLNQLHIKSNGCFLYLEKVLDGVAENFIMLREIRDIPGTLNGLYLWLCQRLFIQKQFSEIQSVLNVILAARSPLTEMQLFQAVWTKNTTLTYNDFHSHIKMMSKILIEGQNNVKILFHHSFAEWLLDVKHCTQKYLCSVVEGHGMLAMSYTLNAQNLSTCEVQDFALHLSKTPANKPMETYHRALWMLMSGAQVDGSLVDEASTEPGVIQMLVQAGAKLSDSLSMKSKSQLCDSQSSNKPISPVVQSKLSPKTVQENQAKLEQMDSNGRNMLHSAAHKGNKQLVNSLISQGANVKTVDISNHTALNLAARQGYSEIVAILLNSESPVNHADKDGWTSLRSAAWGGHTDVVSLLLDAGVDVDYADSDQRTALRAASWSGHDDIVVKLLQHSANVNKEDNEGRTALIAAAYMGHTEIVDHLLNYGANINHEDQDGRTALSVAALCIPASQGHTQVVGLLLDRGAEVDHRDHDGMTPLLVAAYEGHHEVCELLLDGDADVDHWDNNMRTPLLAAASMGHISIVNLLLFWGAAIDPIDTEGRTVLSIAAGQGNLEIVQQLLERGLDEMHRDNRGLTPLHMASAGGHSEVCQLLLEYGAKVNEVDNEGRIPLILASQEGHVQTASMLLDSGSLMDQRAHNGKNAFRVAAVEEHRDLVQLFISGGTDINYKDADGRSTLYVLCLEGKVSTVTYLLENGADPEAEDLEGRTVLHVASWQGNLDMIKLLLHHHANPNAVDNERRTPLQSAAWQGHTQIVRLLLEYGANVDHTCNQGATALCIASQEGHEDIVRTLLQFKANPNHADQYGRTPLKVALKGDHKGICGLLEASGALPLNANNTRKSQASNTSASSTESGKQNKTVAVNTQNTPPITNGIKGLNRVNSPEESPSSTIDRRKSYLSNNSSKSSSNLTSSNSSTNHSSVGMQTMSTHDSGIGLTFTQQIQQCTGSHGKRKSLSRVLSPVTEPQSRDESPADTPNVDNKASPDPSTILHNGYHSVFVRSKSEQPKRFNKSKSGGKSHPKGSADKMHNRDLHGKKTKRTTMNIIENPGAQLMNGADDNSDGNNTNEQVWQVNPNYTKDHNGVTKLELHRKTSMPVTQHEITQAKPKVALGLRSLSPGMRRKRNAIASKPNYVNVLTNANIASVISESNENIEQPETQANVKESKAENQLSLDNSKNTNNDMLTDANRRLPPLAPEVAENILDTILNQQFIENSLPPDAQIAYKQKMKMKIEGPVVVARPSVLPVKKETHL